MIAEELESSIEPGRRAKYREIARRYGIGDRERRVSHRETEEMGTRTVSGLMRRGSAAEGIKELGAGSP